MSEKKSVSNFNLFAHQLILSFSSGRRSSRTIILPGFSKFCPRCSPSAFSRFSITFSIYQSRLCNRLAALHRFDGRREIHLRRSAAVRLFQEVFGWTRNNYDKVGHFMQGFSPALIAREVFIRQNIVNGNGWTLFLAVAVPLAFSAFTNSSNGGSPRRRRDSAEAFLGTQGINGTRRTDMFMCLVGSIASLVIFKRLQDNKCLNGR
jgi:uncharacterized membrane protein YjdF